MICFVSFFFFSSPLTLIALKTVVVTHRSVGKAVEKLYQTLRSVVTCTLLFHLFLFELRSAWHSPLFDSYCKTFTELPNLHQLVATLHFTAINFTTRNVSDAQLGKLNSSNYPPTLLAVSTNRLGVSLILFSLSCTHTDGSVLSPLVFHPRHPSRLCHI